MAADTGDSTLPPGTKLYPASSLDSKWSHFLRERKVGEGTYAVVYLGWAVPKGTTTTTSSTTTTNEMGQKRAREGDDSDHEDEVEAKIARTDSQQHVEGQDEDKDKDDQKKKISATGLQAAPDVRTRVAIKKIRAGHFKDGLDKSAIREVKFLQETRHVNVISLLDVFAHKANLNLVLEYLHGDLEQIIKNSSVVFSAGDVKSWMMMALRGLHHCHRNYILHRDIKPNNLLLSESGVLKLADFGMAREFGDPSRNMSPVVVTRWYRAPELLLGSRLYGYAVDMWAVGCVFAELMLRVPFLAAHSDIQQLETIFKALGTPTVQDWPGIVKLPGYHQSTMYPRTPLRTIFTAATPDSLDLLEKLFNYDPLRRPSAKAALEHTYFYNSPKPTVPEKLPKPR